MSRLVKVGAIALTVVIAAGALLGFRAFEGEAQETPPASPPAAAKSFGLRGIGFGPGGFGRGFGFGRAGCGQAGLDAAAEALDMTTDELSTQLWGGRTLADLADRAGVDLADVRQAVEAACQDASKQAIEDAVDKGILTQEQADWLLQGYDLGFLGGDLHGFGPGFGWRR
jgi:hypothetical protein